ncbi:MAG: hypothetical protein Cons2KO_04380 [Congregibacter sp.]
MTAGRYTLLTLAVIIDWVPGGLLFRMHSKAAYSGPLGRADDLANAET